MQCVPSISPMTPGNPAISSAALIYSLASCADGYLMKLASWNIQEAVHVDGELLNPTMSSNKFIW